MKDNIVPIPTPFKNKASAIGIVPNISAYIGIPSIVDINTANLLLFPIRFSINSCGIQL